MVSALEGELIDLQMKEEDHLDDLKDLAPEKHSKLMEKKATEAKQGKRKIKKEEEEEEEEAKKEPAKKKVKASAKKMEVHVHITKS